MGSKVGPCCVFLWVTVCVNSCVPQLWSSEVEIKDAFIYKRHIVTLRRDEYDSGFYVIELILGFPHLKHHVMNVRGVCAAGQMKQSIIEISWRCGNLNCNMTFKNKHLDYSTKY